MSQEMSDSRTSWAGQRQASQERWERRRWERLKEGLIKIQLLTPKLPHECQ